MSTPKASPVDVQFNRGIRQDLESRLMPPGALTSCVNLEFDKSQKLRRRDGFAAIGTAKFSKSNTYAGPTRRIGTGARGEQLAFTDNNSWIYVPNKDAMCEAGQYNQVSCIRASLTGYFNVGGDQAGTIMYADCASSGTYQLIAYTQLDPIAGTYTVLAEVIDAQTGARVGSTFPLTTGAEQFVQSRTLITASGIGFVFSCATAFPTTIFWARIDLSGSTIGAWTNGSLVTDGKSHAEYFDVAASQGGFVIAYASTITGPHNLVQVVRYDSTPTIIGSAYQWQTAATAYWAPVSIGIAGASGTSDNIFVAAYDPATDNIELLVTAYDLSSPTKAADTSVAAYTAAAPQVIVGRIGADACVGWSDCASQNTGDPRGHFHIGRFRASGSYTPLSMLANYTVGSKFVTDTAGTVYALGRYEDPNGVGSNNRASHLLLLDFGQGSTGFGKPTPVAHVANGRLIYHANSTNPGIGGACITTTNGLLFASPLNIGTTSAAGQQVGCWTGQALGESRYLNVSGHGALYVAGATPLAYDGQRLVELSFYSYPCVISNHGTASNSGGSMAAGAYQYRFVYEWTDAAGNRHQSPACPAISVSIASGSTGSVAWAVPYLHATRKQVSPDAGGIFKAGTADTSAPVRIVCYRTAVGPGSIFYRTGVVGVNKTTAGSSASVIPALVAFTDTAADASITSNEILYERDGGQGKLSSNAPPPSSWLSIHNGRLWGLDIENPERLWCTKTFEVGEAPGYHPALQVIIPNSGTLQGALGQDDKLYAFGTGGTYIGFYGQGPDNTGGGGFPDPVLISPKITCDDPRGIIQGDDGIYFTGPDHWGTGVYLLRRGNANPVSAGLRVRDELQTYPICHGAAYNQRKSRMEFLFVDNDLSPTIARTLYYHFDMLDEEQVGQWTASDFGHASACHCIGTWRDFTVGTDVPVIAYGTALAKQTNTTGPLDVAAANSNLWTLTTGDLRPFGQLGYGDVHSLSLMATIRESAAGAETVAISASYDSGQTFGDAASFAFTETANSPAMRRWEQPTKKLQYAGTRIKVAESNFTGTPCLGLILHSMTIEAFPLGSTVRLVQGSMG